MSFFVGKTRITIEFFFLLALCLFLLVDKTGGGLLMLATIFLHEAGHLLTLWLFNVPISSITFAPYGVNICKQEHFLTRWQEALVYGAGPMVNLIIGGLCYLFAPHRFVWDLFMVFNLVCALFNLLPVGALDGGNLLKLFFSGIDSPKFMGISTWISFIVLAFLFGWSFILFFTQGNFTLLLTCLYLTALWIGEK